MEHSPNIDTQPMRGSKAAEIVLFARIEARLDEYDAYIARDHILAIQGIQNETEALRAAQNG